MEELFADIEQLAQTEKRVAMATLVATRGTSPKREGAKMCVGEEGRILGSVTIGGCVDARVIAESEQALSSFESRLVEMKLGNEDAWEIGFSCAGDLDVFIPQGPGGLVQLRVLSQASNYITPLLAMSLPLAAVDPTTFLNTYAFERSGKHSIDDLFR